MPRVALRMIRHRGDVVNGVTVPAWAEVRVKVVRTSIHTLPQLALRWCIDHPAVKTMIPGAQNPAQAKANANAAASDLPPSTAATLAKLREFFIKDVKPLVRGPD